MLVLLVLLYYQYYYFISIILRQGGAGEGFEPGLERLRRRGAPHNWRYTEVLNLARLGTLES